MLNISSALLACPFIKPWIAPSVLCIIIFNLRTPFVHFVFKILSLTLEERLVLLFENKRRGIGFGIRTFMSAMGFLPFYYLKHYIWMENVVVTLVVVGVTILVMEVVRVLFLYAKDKSRILKDGDTIDLTNLLINIAQIIICLTAVIVLLNQYSHGLIHVSSLLYFLSFLTAGVSFAARDYISNFFASIGILMSDPFSKGDVVAIYDMEGKIESFGFQQTIMRQKDQSLVYIANAQLMTTRVFINKSRVLNKPILIIFFISADVNRELLQKSFNTILDFLLTHEKMVKNNKANIFVDEIRYGLLKIELTTFLKSSENRDVEKQEIIFFVRDILAAEKIQFKSEYA